MKKNILYLLTVGFLLTAFVSCLNESTAVNTVESLKSQEMLNFDTALKSISAPENRGVALGNSEESNAKRIELLLPSAKALLLANGFSERRISKETNNDKAKMINLASQIYFKNYAQYENRLKKEK